MTLAEEQLESGAGASQARLAAFRAVRSADGRLVDLLLVEVSPRAEALLGEPAGRALGKPPRQLRLLLGPADLLAVGARVLETGVPWVGDVVEPGAAGHERLRPVATRLDAAHLALWWTPVAGGAREAPEGSAEAFCTLAENAPDVIARFDRELRHLYVNPAAALAWGVPVERLVGRTHAELGLPPALVAQWEGGLRRAFETAAAQTMAFSFGGPGGPAHYEARLVPERGAAGEVRSVLAIARNVSERQRMEEALRESEQRYRLATRAAREAIWDWDIAAGRVSWTDALCELYGYAPEEVSPDVRWWSEVLHPEDRERVVGSLRAAIVGGGHTWQDTYRVRRRDGSWAHVASRGFIDRDADGRALHMVGAMQDVTERRRLEGEEHRRREFEQQLIGIVSHDLRNPLGVITLAVSGLLRRGRELDAAVAKAAGRIQSANQRAVRLVRDLLDFTQARLGGGIPVHPEALDLHTLAAQAVGEVQALFPQREVRLEHEGEAAGAWDPDRLAQVVDNLVTNALKYGTPSSPVTVRVRGAPRAVVLEVHNEGPPIPPHLRPRLFEPLHRTDAGGDRGGRSVGLGLYIVQQVVHAHGGHVEVESDAAGGTTFRVHLPRGSLAAAPPAPARAQAGE